LFEVTGRRVDAEDYTQDTSFEEDVFANEEEDQLAFIRDLLGANARVERDEGVDSHYGMSIPVSGRLD